MFVGVYDRSIDDNGRLGLPAPFRGELGDRCYATLDPQGVSPSGRSPYSKPRQTMSSKR